MANVIESISLKGFRKAHLRQLSSYIRARDREEWYYGPLDQFEKRHADLLELADRLDKIADDPDTRLPK